MKFKFNTIFSRNEDLKTAGERFAIVFIVLGVLAALLLTVLVGDRGQDRNDLIRKFNTAFFSRDFSSAMKLSCLSSTANLEAVYENLSTDLGRPLSVGYVNNVTFEIVGSRTSTGYRHLPLQRVNGSLLVCPRSQVNGQLLDSLFVRS